MRTRRIIYLVIGSLLIVLNLLVDLVGYAHTENPEYDNDTAYRIGTMIGGHFLLIIGAFLLLGAYRLSSKINNFEDKEIKKSIEEIGNNNY